MSHDHSRAAALNAVTNPLNRIVAASVRLHCAQNLARALPGLAKIEWCAGKPGAICEARKALQRDARRSLNAAAERLFKGLALARAL